MDLERSRSMSLIPYQPEQSGQIVLRHNAAVVVYNERSKELSIRGVPSSDDGSSPSSCPTCRRPYGTSPVHEEAGPPMSSGNDNDYLNPGYFRMLQNSVPATPSPSRPMTPSRQLREESGVPDQNLVDPPAGAEFVSSAPSPKASGGISASALSPGYFERFFVAEGELGRGGKGVVLLVRHMLDRVSLGQFACKRVPVGDDHAWLEKVLVEVQLLQTLSHQNLVSYRHVWLQDYKVNSFGPSVPCAFILQQYCNGGDLQRYILGGQGRTDSKEQLKNRMRTRSKGNLDPPVDLRSHRRMPFEDIFSFFQDITSGLHHLHIHGYIHRDLKPQNCLLHREGNKTRILVSDFGEMQSESQIRTSSGATGTIAYCAPEVLRKSSSNGAYGAFTTKSDVFSLGMIVYFMCFGKLPYSSADQINDETEDLDLLREEISAWMGVSEEWKNLPDRLFSALKRLLALDSDERPNTEEILQALLSNRSVSPEAVHERRGSHSRTAGAAVIDGRRISSLDTPAATPKRRISPRGRQNSLIRHAPNLVPSTLQHAFVDDEARSPQRSSFDNGRQASTTTSGVQDLALIRSRHTSPLSDTGFNVPPNPSRSLSPSKRLALPAPPPPRNATTSVLISASPSRQAIIKLSIFLLKYLSMTRPCSPYTPNPYLTYPLLLLAVLDFTNVSVPGLGSRMAGFSAYFFQDTLKSGLLLCFHLLVVWVAGRCAVLCERPALGVYL